MIFLSGALDSCQTWAHCGYQLGDELSTLTERNDMTTSQATTTESWDERIARETREENEAVAALKAKLAQACTMLDGWTFDPEAKHLPHFTHTETGAQFYVTMPCRYGDKSGKVEACASWPKSQDGKTCSAGDWQIAKYGEHDKYRIGFSIKKTAKAIAGDFLRRLIPQTLEGMAIVNETIATQAAALDLVDSAVNDLSIIFKTSDIREKSYYAAKLYFDGGSARISNHGSDGAKPVSVSLELSSITVEQASAIAALLENC